MNISILRLTRETRILTMKDANTANSEKQITAVKTTHHFTESEIIII